MTYAHISTSTPQRSDIPEYGKWVLYCLHTDEAGESYTAFEYDNNYQRLAKKRIRSKLWCCYCRGAVDI